MTMGTVQSSIGSDDLLTHIKKSTQIKFYLQNREHSVQTENIDPATTLNFYLRNILHLTGTKGMCYEGGCGSCVVVLHKQDPITQKKIFMSVNSCLVPLLSCNGWQIFTVEGIGNPLDGFHPIQETLANFNGTQCGFCSPGMVMNMFALYESGKLTMEQVEKSFSGNICRCTGYRPILSAFKSLCTDASTEVLGECPDIEDFVLCYKEKCVQNCVVESDLTKPFFLSFTDSSWIKVYTLRDLLRILNNNQNIRYRLVGGNTAQGVYSSYKERVQLYLDITDVFELKVHEVADNSCTLGAALTLTDTIEFFTETAKLKPQFAYLKTIADHISLVANVPVRNRATIGGNLIIKHDHPEFPSDIFVLLESVSATLTVVDSSGHESTLSPLQFIHHDMNKVVLKNITLVPYPSSVKYISYKIMPRAQNTHAYVNSGFLFKFDKNQLLQSATIVYGNVNPDFTHATQTENFLKGKKIFDTSVLQLAFSKLSNELDPNEIPPDPSPEFRKQLAVALLYKAILSIAPSDKVTAKYKSGGEMIKRSVSRGTQDYETNKSLYPVTQPVPKLEALAQTSGQAQYTEDIPDLPYQLYAGLVLAKAPANSRIIKIDPAKALKSQDIVAFYDKGDIPGDNNFTPIIPFVNAKEEIFCSSIVKYYEQPLGVLVGKSQRAVDDALDSVIVTYEFSTVAPLLSVRQILKSGKTERIKQYKTITASKKETDVKHIVRGSFDIYQQYHFHMENQCCNVIPTEDGLDVYCSSQWMDLTQLAIAKMLNIPQSLVNLIVRRCGGAFGGKISRNNLPSCAAALASWKLKKPVKIWLPLKTNMAALGKRFPLSTDYEVGVNDTGVIQYLNCSHYTDVGYLFNEDVADWLEKIFLGIYKSKSFTISFNRAMTDTPVNTWARAPGSLEGLSSIESIIEHIAYAINQDPLQVRLANLSDRTPIANYISDIKSWALIDQRKSDIATFNKQNRWKKRGLAVVPMSFDMLLLGPFTVIVSIFHGDGSVQISHGGIECGQGINTKAAQVCAYKLGIPLEKVRVLPSNTFAGANSTITGASLTSEAVCYGIIQACDELLNRIQPYKPQNSKWEEVIKKSYENYVNLTAGGIYSPNEKGVKPYNVYGICAAEVLVDILTGQHIVTRVDLIEDTGVSTNPIIDIGQVEGAFIMGLGYYTTEKTVFSYEGRLLTNNTWTYWPPGARDIPLDFRVKFPKNKPNPVGVLQSKGTGEPAICLAIAVPFAIRNALASARTDAAASNPRWFPMNGPTDLESVFVQSLNHYSQYVL